jgi:hypothetical protein
MLVLRALFLFPGLFVYYFVFCRWIHCLIEWMNGLENMWLEWLVDWQIDLLFVCIALVSTQTKQHNTTVWNLKTSSVTIWEKQLSMCKLQSIQSLWSHWTNKSEETNLNKQIWWSESEGTNLKERTWTRVRLGDSRGAPTAQAAQCSTLWRKRKRVASAGANIQASKCKLNARVCCAFSNVMTYNM